MTRLADQLGLVLADGPAPRYRVPRRLLAQLGIEVTEDNDGAFVEVEAMRILANLAIAARVSSELVLPAAAAGARMLKALPEWYPAVFIGELEPFQTGGRHGQLAVKYPISYGRIVDPVIDVGWSAGRPKESSRR